MEGGRKGVGRRGGGVKERGGGGEGERERERERERDSIDIQNVHCNHFSHVCYNDMYMYKCILWCTLN